MAERRESRLPPATDMDNGVDDVSVGRELLRGDAIVDEAKVEEEACCEVSRRGLTGSAACQLEAGVVADEGGRRGGGGPG